MFGTMFYFVICAEMAGRSLLNADIDRVHRAALLEAGTRLEPLVTRTPKENWRIHPAWVQRSVFYLFLCSMIFFCDTLT